VNLDKDPCVSRTAACVEDAISVERYFIAHLGTDGGIHDSADDKALSVYAYKKTASTHP
jgi:hypothetical protein